MSKNQKIKKELVYDLHIVHGPRKIVALTEKGARFFLRLAPLLNDGEFYKTALDAGLHVSFEDDELRNRFTASTEPNI